MFACVYFMRNDKDEVHVVAEMAMAKCVWYWPQTNYKGILKLMQVAFPNSFFEGHNIYKLMQLVIISLNKMSRYKTVFFKPVSQRLWYRSY